MIAIHGQTYTFFDCDDTLVLWNASQEDIEKNGIDFVCPTSTVMCYDASEAKIEYTWTKKLVPHKRHIEELKRHKSRHSIIVVWSAAGSEWAETVVKTLRLEQYVDLVIAKPTWCYDDLQVNEFIPKPRWHKDE